jgi:hypothetical protein
MTDALCSECGNRHSLEDFCPDPEDDGEEEVYNQDLDQDLDPELPFASHEPLGLGCIGGPSEIGELRAAYHAGRLKPTEVRLGPIPAHFGSAQRAVAEDLMGLRSAEGETRALPYPTSAAVSAGLAKDKAQASRILRRLVNAGVVVSGKQLKRYKAQDGRVLSGTKTYAPPGGSP